ncbi:MAG: hypothetical protein ACR2IV_17490 [Bryobacteraceae bacterium]
MSQQSCESNTPSLLTLHPLVNFPDYKPTVYEVKGLLEGRKATIIKGSETWQVYYTDCHGTRITWEDRFFDSPAEALQTLQAITDLKS